jgi:hypothetical protein
MADRLEEAIRVVIETQGREGVDELRAAFGDLGDVSVETAGKATKLLDSLTGLNEAAAKADAFDGMLTELAQLEQQFDDNQKAALALSLSIGEMDKPSREVLATQRDLRKEGERLKKALNEQWDAVGKADDELSSLGVNTANLADHQQRLRIEVARSAAALTEQARAAAAEAEAGRRRKQQIDEAETAFRKQANTSRAAAKSLAEYRERADDASAGSADLASATESTVSWFGKLKAVAAGALAFVGLNRVVDGIKAIGKAVTLSRSCRNWRPLCRRPAEAVSSPRKAWPQCASSSRAGSSTMDRSARPRYACCHTPISSESSSRQQCRSPSIRLSGWACRWRGLPRSLARHCRRRRRRWKA